MTSPSNPTSALVGSIASQVVAMWARVAVQMWRNGMQLLTVPLELADEEEGALEVWRTNVYLEADKDAEVRLRCTAKDVSTGRSIDAGIELDPCDYVATGKPEPISIALRRTLGAGLYEVTLEDETGAPSATYLLPFGVPGRRR